jgi:hypothetical protein
MGNIFGDNRKSDSRGVPYELSRDELYKLNPELNPANSGMHEMSEAIKRDKQYQIEVEQARREGRLH